MARRFIVETVTNRTDGYTEYFRRTVELAPSEDKEAVLAVGDNLTVTNEAYPLPRVCEVVGVAPELVRLKLCAA